MNIFTKSQQADTRAAARPELWVPDNLAGLFCDMQAGLRTAYDPLRATPGWFEGLSGGAALGSPTGAPLAEVVRRGSLAAHLRDAFTTTHFGGSRPGSVRPPLSRQVSAPVPLKRGGESVALTQLKQVGPGHPEFDAERTAYYADQARVPEFIAIVEETALDVLNDRARAWEAHVHLAILAEVRREHSRRAAAQEAEAHRLAVQQCPVCLAHDTQRIGPVALRALLPGLEHVFEDTPSLRSCLACWNVATVAHVAGLSSEIVDDAHQLDRGAVVSRSLRDASAPLGR